jgi:hypothetical protein
MDYQAYLKSEYWKQRRYATLERANFRCELCSETDNLNVHHLTYERLGNESPDDLMVICGGHHWIEHSGLKDYRPATQHVKPVFCSAVLRWQKKTKAIQSHEYQSQKSKQRLIELEAKFQDHIKRCSVCKIPQTI